MGLKTALKALASGNDLTKDLMMCAMREVMTGAATDAQIGALLMALHIKGETIDEIVGAATVMRALSTKVVVSADYLVDTCGTGGDGSNIFNVSTAAAFVAAAAGAQVAKHGNRSVSSSTGSADVLERAGVNLNLSAEHVARAINSIGVGFMFAPAHHGAMKHAIGPRKELAMRTIFNVLGPMTNPAAVKRQVMGVFDERLCVPIAKALGDLGSEHVLVVHSDDGLDELSIAASSTIAELKHGQVKTYTLTPEDVDIKTSTLDGLEVSTAQESLEIIRNVFQGESSEITSRASDLVAFNAGAAIYVAGVTSTLKLGVQMAQDAIATGAAKLKLEELVAFSNIGE